MTRRKSDANASTADASLDPRAASQLDASAGAALAAYRAKRDFDQTAEPAGVVAPVSGNSYVIQKHSARRMHYDLRLELDGVLKSWALPKGPSYDPADKRAAILVEDHPIEYGSFEGTIAPKQYGAGQVIVWDRGHWQPINEPREGIRQGKLVFELQGQKLLGLWELIRIGKAGDEQKTWLFFKKRDAFARPRADYDVLTALPDSVLTESPAVGDQARRAPLPKTLAPQLATLAAAAPRSNAPGQWLSEIKFDGYRIMARIDADQVALITRGGHDWADKLPALAAKLKSLKLGPSWLDGEIVVLDDAGVPSFSALQRAIDDPRRGASIVYFVFDAPFLNGFDLRDIALQQRRGRLLAALDGKFDERLRLSQVFDAEPAAVFASSGRMNLEGIVVKRADSRYLSRRTDFWLKLKRRPRQEFIIAGFSARSDDARAVGSLQLAVYDGDKLCGAGAVGTGWSAAQARELMQRLTPLEVNSPHFDLTGAGNGRYSKREAAAVHWVAPTLIAEVEFADWTPDQHVRHASFVGLREDKDPKLIVREWPSAVLDAPSSAASAGQIAGVKVTHGDRVIDESSGLTKLELVRYYESVAEFMLPHLRGRPVSLVRAPGGVTGKMFFQKHDEPAAIPGLLHVDRRLSASRFALLEVPDAQALVSAAQMNVIEFHTLNVRSAAIHKPDRVVFDLDPGEGTTWQQMQEAAMLVRTLLEAIGLRAWLKTSGGRGLHLLVPIEPRFDEQRVLAFSKRAVEHLVKTIPGRFVAKTGAQNRVGKIFVDYLRNRRGATTVAAFSARARPGVGVSMPIGWDELAKLKGPNDYDARNARDHLSFVTEDPWKEFWTARQPLGAADARLK